jgi:hypothetical protein
VADAAPSTLGPRVRMAWFVTCGRAIICKRLLSGSWPSRASTARCSRHWPNSRSSATEDACEQLRGRAVGQRRAKRDLPLLCVWTWCCSELGTCGRSRPSSVPRTTGTRTMPCLLLVQAQINAVLIESRLLCTRHAPGTVPEMRWAYLASRVCCVFSRVSMPSPRIQSSQRAGQVATASPFLPSPNP